MRRILLSLAPSAVTGVLALLLWLNDAWQRVGVPLGDRNFGDLHVITLAATCARGNLAWRATDAPCVDGISHYNYPSLWAQLFGFLGADGSWTDSVAVAMIVTFLLALVPLTWFAIGESASISRAVIMTVVALMPPVWLSFQRGNTDLAAFALVVAASLLWLKDRRVTSGVTIAIAATFKIFPIGAGLLLLQRQRFSRGAVIACIAASALGFFLIAPDLPVISQRTPQIDGASFGLGLLPLLAFNTLDVPLGLPAARVVGAALLIAITAMLVMTLKALDGSPLVQGWRSLLDELSADTTSHALILASGGAFLMAYLLGPSYDYRLIFLIPVIAGLLRIKRNAARISVTLLMSVMALSYNTFVGPAEYIADALLLGLVPWMMISAWIMVRQPVRFFKEEAATR